jgi:ankyrin repeat protein
MDHGSLPLHITCRANASPGLISLLLGVFSDATQFQDADCRLPLHWACHVNPMLKLAIFVGLHCSPSTETKQQVAISVQVSSTVVEVESISSTITK